MKAAGSFFAHNQWILVGIIVAAGVITATAAISQNYVPSEEQEIEPEPAPGNETEKEAEVETETEAATDLKAREIYPTKDGGREWFLDMEDPSSDGIFDPRTRIIKQADGSWLVSGADNGKYQVRMSIGTPALTAQWKNVEITGYFRVIDTTSSKNAIQLYSRGGNHNSSVPCEGTALKGRIYVDGSVDWIKEIWHAGGYTNPQAEADATDSLLERWVGWKVAIYNIQNNTAVKMESYLDDKADNSWRKVTEYTDTGDWSATGSNAEFYRVDCGKPRDYVITNSGPIVTFRSDNIIWEFKDLSVREIQPPA